MKKAEAISILATSVRPREAKDRARYDEAVKMAIEALKSSETPKSSERTAESAQNTSSCARENDVIFRQAAIDAMGKAKWAKERLEQLPSAQPKYEPVTAEDFAKVMSESTIYGFMAWYGEALALMKRMGFVICKKT